LSKNENNVDILNLVLFKCGWCPEKIQGEEGAQ
jgi:hypothetical protein